jgi:dienelactone hydrolase
LFLAATSLIAIHAVVDTQIAPQRGTGFADNLAPLFGPLVVLALAAFGYPRLRPGFRAAIAALLGLLSAEAAAIAFADATRTFARPSDFTGFLLAPAAATLLAIAATLLWRSRRGGRYRYLRRAGLAGATVLGCFWIAAPVGMALYATHRPRAEVVPADLGAPYRRVRIPTSDGLSLAAWYVQPRNGAAIVAFPTRIGKLAQARMLIRHGYGVLMLDMRGYEESEGIPNALGWGSTKDIDAGVDWLARQPDVQAIGGIGFSVGGEQMLEAAADNRRLRAVVSEGAGERSIHEELLHGWRAALVIPISAVQTAAIAALSQTLPPPALSDLAAKISPRAAFFIYAEHGNGGEELNRTFYERAGRPKQIWQVHGSGHVGGLDAQPGAYERRVSAFFDRYLLRSTK